MSSKFFLVEFLVKYAYYFMLLLYATLEDTVAEENTNVAAVNKTVTVHRIVTDSSVIHSGAGVPIDFGYNETMTRENGTNYDGDVVPSAPGCPKSTGGLPWLYHGNPPSCYLIGTAGSCPPGQLLFGDGTSHFAHCGCMCSPRDGNNETGWWGSGYEVKVREHSRFVFCALKDTPEMNEAVFDKQTGTCSYFDTQGPCEEGEWLVRNKTLPGNVACVPQCSSETGPFQSSLFYDWKAGKCELKSTLFIQPVSLAAGVGPSECEEGKVFSRTLQKCIPKSKAFILKL